MPNRSMSFNSLIRALAICGCALVAGCDPSREPPIQLEAQIKVVGEIPSERALAKDFARYLGIKGARAGQLRIVLNEHTKAYSLRLVGEDAIPRAFLEQVAKDLAAADKEINWPVKLSIAKLAELDAFLKTTQRDFPLVLGWQRAKVEPYLGSRPGTQATGIEQNVVACMLSFKADGAMPELQGRFSEVYGKNAEKSAPRNMGEQSVFQVPHDIAFEQAALAEAFGKPLAQDGKIMFKFAVLVLADQNVVDLGAHTSWVDTGDKMRDECKDKLKEQYRAISERVDRARLLWHVESIGPARLVPLSGQ